MIVTTVGRKVWYRPCENDRSGVEGMAGGVNAPLDATVVCVHSDRLVNLVVFDANGNMFKRTSVTLLQDDDPSPASGRYAEWMPYQTAQAKKESV